MKDKILEKILNELHDMGNYKSIIEYIEKIPKTEWDYDLKIHLARAYNNNSEFDKAINILITEQERGHNENYWNYVIGYAYFHKNNYELALKYFKMSYDLGRESVQDYIEICKQAINNEGGFKVKVFADKFRQFGFNISCISNIPNEYNSNSRSYFKTPNHSWKNLFNFKQTESEYNSYDWIDSVGTGTFTSWNKLVVIDIDGCNDILFLKQILSKLGLPVDYEWVIESGSKNGYHIYYYGDRIDECKDNNVVSTFPPKNEYEKYLDKIEFLWKTHVVLPPSVHSSGKKYSFLNNKFPLNPPFKINKSVIYDFINTFLDFDEIEVGDGYGEVFTRIKSKTDFISDIKEVDMTKYLLDDVYLFIDIETSGLPMRTGTETKFPEILQIAWILTNSSGTVLKKQSFIIDTLFFKLNSHSNYVNIDFEVADIVKFPLDKALKKLAEDLKISDYLVAHNVEFDTEILGSYYMKFYGINPFIKKNKICTMKSTVDFCEIVNEYGYKYPKLSELYFKLFDYQIKNLHNAEIDVLNTLKCFKKLRKIGIL